MIKEITSSISDSINQIKAIYKNDEKIIKMYENGIKNTFLSTLQPQENGETFVITGDIPAMWLRDSAAQVRPLLLFAKNDTVIFNLIAGVIKLQMKQIQIDPYANAFNNGAIGKGHQTDQTDMKPEIWERKYEIDSLCYPIQLSYLFWKTTDSTEHFNEAFISTCLLIIDTFGVEQNHMENSSYIFERIEEDPDRLEYETLSNNGMGNPVSYTGMTWSGFRPSDDACKYGYLIPSNMFAVVILRYIEEIATNVLKDKELANQAIKLADKIDEGIKKNAIIKHPKYGEIYAYEVDGNGNYLLMDDANVPSLLSIPYLGYVDFDDPIYLNTRKFLLSKDNPFYYEGKVARGIGSPHTPSNYIWHIALAIQGMTTLHEEEQKKICELFTITDAGTDLMHEGFDVNNPCNFSRPWFSWANSMYAEFILSINDIVVKGSPLDNKKNNRRR
ncbi:glycoside hydrolase family 125 protein [Vallitalea sediminicola]